ncbi:19418_t:CDS:2, partial [Gigaspora rosea]
MHVFAFLLGIAKANAFLSFKKWRNGAYNVSYFDFKQQLAFEILNRDYLNLRNSSPNSFVVCIVVKEQDITVLITIQR